MVSGTTTMTAFMSTNLYTMLELSLFISLAFNVVLVWLLREALLDLSEVNKRLRYLEYQFGRRDA